MIGVHSDPSPEQLRDRNNGILQVVHNLAQNLPEFGYQYVADPRAAHLYVHHAGSSNGMPIGVEHCHGLIPTGMLAMSAAADGINAAVIDNIIRARAVTVPSEWVADVIRRDMRFEPFVIPWGLNIDEWEPGEDGGYVLWAKGRVDLVCDPIHMNRLARLCPDVRFVSTFGEPGENIQLVKEQPFFAMKEMLRNASVYLATTRETFGIQTLEAMACGVPILGFRWAGTMDIVEHRVTGFLAEPENYQELEEGLRFCLKNRKELGENAREEAARFTWRETARQMAGVYEFALRQHEGPGVSVIIPCYNYAQYVEQAIQSVLRQNLPCGVELIVVDDGSTDNSWEVISRLSEEHGFRAIHKENGGVSSARMAGFEASRGEYVVFLDADDMIEPRFLQVNWDAMRKNERLGISYTPIRLLTSQGIKPSNWPPSVVDHLMLARGFNQVPTCCMIRRKAFVRAGGYRARFEPTEDGELWARIAEVGYRAECATMTPLFTYRLGHPSLSRGVALPDYVGWHMPARVGHPPCALPKTSGAYPVRDYDRPVFDIVVAHTQGGKPERLYETLDSLMGQSYMFWRCFVVYESDNRVERLPDMTAYPFVTLCETSLQRSKELYGVGVEEGSAPLIMLVESGVVLPGRTLDTELRAYQDGEVRAGVMPRVWYNELERDERAIWLAGAAVGEVLHLRQGEKQK